MTPRDQMSVRASTSREERSCSGDMYTGEPMMAWVLVTARSAVGPDILEMPKSSTLMEGVPSGPLVRKRFSGLRSRWTMPAPCASASASHAWST